MEGGKVEWGSEVDLALPKATQHQSVEVRTSPIAGSGLFAKTAIATDSYLLPYVGPLVSNEEVQHFSRGRLSYLFAYDDTQAG